MSKIEKFEDLEVWKESISLATEIYSILKICNDFSLKDQMQRSVVSIASNIAEGFERNFNNEFIQFLYSAKASCGELRTQLHIASNIDILRITETERLVERTRKISAMLYKLIKTGKEKLIKIIIGFRSPLFGLRSPV